MRVIYLPLEDLHQRYNVMMNRALQPLVDVYLYPKGADYSVIKDGQFLDISQTIAFKAAQLRMVADLFTGNHVQDGDVFLVGDIFFPGIESIRYMAELKGIKIRMYGFNYAGRADFDDFVRKLGRWADVSEAGYHEVMDGIFVGSNFHKDNVCKYFRLPEGMIHVTGYIWDISYIEKVLNEGTVYPADDEILRNDKEEYCIWPHRIAKEKGWDEFLKIAQELPEVNFIITSCGNPVIDPNTLPRNVSYRHNLTKKQYYEIFKYAKYYLSTAYQETFGYTLQEAIFFGCRIAVPARACYPEMVGPSHVYRPRLGGIAAYHTAEQIKECWECRPVPIVETYKWNDNAKKIMQIIGR